MSDNKKNKSTDISYTLDLEKLNKSKKEENKEKTKSSSKIPKKTENDDKQLKETLKKNVELESTKISNKKTTKKIEHKIKTDKKDVKDKKDTTNKNKTSKKIEQTKKEVNKKTSASRKKRLKRASSKKNNKKRNFFAFIIILILIIPITIIGYKSNYNKQQEKNQNKQRIDIISHYNEYVMTNKEADIYKLNNNKYTKIGKVGKNQELTLDTKEITYKDNYLKIKTFEEEYYIYYKDLDIIEELSTYDTRYKKYIVFNKNIVTKDKTNFYDEEGTLVYTFNSSFNLPIIINKENIYGVEFNDRLLYVKKEDISEIKENKNTESTNTKGIAVLNYHFFYDETKASERKDCNQIICHSKSGFTKHLEYIKNNNIFTPTMNEFEMYLNKEINLPKSVMITIDDGWRTQIATELLEKYQLNATIFLITSWFEEINFLDFYEYTEYHSHGDNIHNQGDCPGGQGGAIKCFEKTKLLKDLNLSRKKLDGSTAFCYPFYEYNNYSISVLKEAGFTLAFASGFRKATPNTDKYQIPRYVMYDSTTVNELKSYIG